MNKIKIGIIGYGGIAKTHVRVIKENPKFSLVAVLDKENKSEEVKKEINEKTLFYTMNRIQEFLEVLDAVVVATPPYLHAEQSIQALKAGKHVLVEKPIATNLEDAIKMKKASKEAGKVLMVTAHMKYNPKIQRFVKKQRKGELGEIIRAEANILSNINAYMNNDWIFDKRKSGGGTVIDDGVNAFDCLLEILNEKIKVTKVEKFGYKDIGGIERDVETEAEIKFVFGKNKQGIMRLEWNRENEEIYLVLETRKEGKIKTYKIDIKEFPDIGDFTHSDYIEVYNEFLRRIRKGPLFGRRDLNSLKLVTDVYKLMDVKY